MNPGNPAGRPILAIAQRARAANLSEGWAVDFSNATLTEIDIVKLQLALEKFIEAGSIPGQYGYNGFYPHGHGHRPEDFKYRDAAWGDLLAYFWSRDEAVAYLRKLVDGVDRAYVHHHHRRLVEAMRKVAQAYPADEEVALLIARAPQTERDVAAYAYGLLYQQFSGFQSVARVLFDRLMDEPPPGSRLKLVSFLVNHVREMPHMFEEVAKHALEMAPQMVSSQFDFLAASAPENWPLEPYLEAVMRAMLDAAKSNSHVDAGGMFNVYMNYFGFWRDSARLCREVARARGGAASSAVHWLAWLHHDNDATLTLLLEIFQDSSLHMADRSHCLHLLIIFYGNRDEVVRTLSDQLRNEPDGPDLAHIKRILTGETFVHTYSTVSRVIMDAEEREQVLRASILKTIARHLE